MIWTRSLTRAISDIWRILNTCTGNVVCVTVIAGSTCAVVIVWALDCNCLSFECLGLLGC